jgi:hypothetical protein
MKIYNYFKRNNPNDERIIKEQAYIAARLYPVMVMMAFLVFLFKIIILDLSFSKCILESTAVILSFAYYIIRVLRIGIPLKLSKDVYLLEVQQKYLSHSYFICFFIIIFGEFSLALLSKKDELAVTSLYFIVWIIPSLIFVYKTTRNGLMTFGTKNKKLSVLKKFKRTTVIGSIFYGVTMQWHHLFINGFFNYKGLINVLISAVTWGVPFYFIMKGIFGISEKNADKALED